MDKKPWVKPAIRVTSAKLEIIDRLSRIEKALSSLRKQVHNGQKEKESK